MPDYGKLLFQALETNDLSSILLKNSGKKKPTSDLPATVDELSVVDGEVQDEEEPVPPTLISETSFRLIERMVTYSGARRPSARQALCELSDSSQPSSVDELPKSSLDETSQSREDGREAEEDTRLLEQCILDVQQILEELKQLKEREADEDEYGGGGGGMFMFGGAGRRRGKVESVGENEDDNDDGQRSIRSDDFSRYDSQVREGGPSHYGLDYERQLFEEYDERRHYGYVDELDEGNVNGGGAEEEGFVRAVKRHRGVSDVDSAEGDNESTG